MLDGLSLDAFWLWLGRVADLASLVAAAFAFIAAKKIGALKSKLVFNARMEPLVEGIRETLEDVGDFVHAYPAERLRIETAIRRCLVPVYRHSARFSPDAQVIVEQLKALEKSLDAPHTGAGELDGLLWRKSSIEEIIIRLEIVAAHIDESRISRQIGGDDA